MSMLTNVVLMVCMNMVGTTMPLFEPQQVQQSWHFKGNNVALDKPATHEPNTFENDSHPARFAVDGNSSTNFYHGTCSHTDSNNNTRPSWAVDLKGQYFVTGIVIYNRDELHIRLKSFLVYGCSSECHDKWNILYDDNIKNKYLQNIIHIELDGKTLYSKIRIEIPIYSVGKLSYLTLCEVKVYAAPVPACPTNIPAVDIKDVENGIVVIDKYTVGTRLRVECAMNYFLVGGPVIECTSNGSYTGRCIPGCPVPSSISNGKMFTNDTWIKINATLNIKCDEGYKPITPFTIRCCKNGVFCEPIFNCTAVQCKSPKNPLNGHYNLNTMVQYRATIHGYCNDGYTADVANTSRTCQYNGTWSGSQFYCQPVVCSKPKTSENVIYTYVNGSQSFVDSEVYKTKLIGNCSKGYRASGISELECGPMGTWLGTEQRCSIVTCYALSNFTNGYYEFFNSSRLLNYGTELNARCYDGYNLTPKSSARICEESGLWSGDSPACVQIKCPWPLKLQGGYYTLSNKQSTNDGLPYNTTITATCTNDFHLLNDSTIIRKCGENGKWSNSETTCIRKEDNENSPLAMIIGVSSSVTIVCVVVTVAVILTCRKRRIHKKPTKEYTDIKSSNHQYEGEYSEIQETCLDQPAMNKRTSNENRVYENAKPEVRDFEEENGSSSRHDVASNAYYNLRSSESLPKFAIKTDALSDIILKGDAATSRFEKEFEKLPGGMIREHLDAVKRENIGKNRYKNLYAYDHSRVVLAKENVGQSDYINACYVNGYNKAKAYIASQGPTKEILNDFWRMIWQTDCGKIVMLTNLTEENKSKCTQYWPTDGEVVYDEITVGLQKSESFSEFVIRTFIVKKLHSKARHVTQFHFTAWPDKDVPKYASSLVQFRNKVKYASTHRHGPIVVHCSAGVGRTGTFIALDYLTEQANDVGYVDVFGSVEEMRKQRVNFVQTLDQYIFVHHALVEALMLSTSALPSNKFPEWYASMLQVDHRAHKRKLDIEFETLSKLSPNAEEAQYFTAKQIRNRKKNRYSNILPVDDFMPQLEPLDGTHGDTTYINAVFLQSYREKNAFIITQTPLEGTRDDFWRLVWEHDVHIIVMMNNIHEASKAEQYWPDDRSVFKSRNIKIEHTQTEELKHHKVLTFSLQKYAISRKIVQVQCGGWQPNHNLPDSKDVILSLLDTVQSLQRKIGNQSVLVHCMNGADKSGLFCVISAVIERMKIEQDVAITQVIEEMRNAREQIIPNVQQYEFCHEAVLAYIEEFSTYSNFSL